MSSWPARLALVAALAAPLLAIPGQADAAPRRLPSCVASIADAPGRAWISRKPTRPGQPRWRLARGGCTLRPLVITRSAP
jgi:hypothetical protein